MVVAEILAGGLSSLFFYSSAMADAETLLLKTVAAVTVVAAVDAAMDVAAN